MAKDFKYCKERFCTNFSTWSSTNLFFIAEKTSRWTNICWNLAVSLLNKEVHCTSLFQNLAMRLCE